MWQAIQAAVACAMASNFSLISAFDGARFLRTKVDGQQCCRRATCLQPSRAGQGAAIALSLHNTQLQRPAGAAHLWYFHVFPTILAGVISKTLPGLPGTLPCTTMAPRSSSTLITCCNAQQCDQRPCCTRQHNATTTLHTPCLAVYTQLPCFGDNLQSCSLPEACARLQMQLACTQALP